MNKIPISFDYKGIHYTGFFQKVFGAGANVWHLMIDNYYYGALQLTGNYGWAFHGNQMTELADYFGDYVTAWHQ